MGKTRDVREAVEAELAVDPRVDATNIIVRNVQGEVALNGTVPSYPQFLAAAAAARRVAGVTSVHNHLEVVLPAGNYRDDAVLTTAANNALTQNVTVPAGIEATARDGNLELISRGHHRNHGHPVWERPHLGRARRGGRRGLDGRLHRRRARRAVRHRLTDHCEQEADERMTPLSQKPSRLTIGEVHAELFQAFAAAVDPRRAR